MLAQRLRRWANIKQTMDQRFVFAGISCWKTRVSPWKHVWKMGDSVVLDPTNMIHWTNTGLLLAQRRERWANIKTALVQRPVLTQN